MTNCPGTVLFLAGSPMWAHIYGVRNGLLAMGARVLTVGTSTHGNGFHQSIMDALHKHDPTFAFDLICEPDEEISQILASVSAKPDLILYMENAAPFLPRGLAAVPMPTIGVLTEDFSHADWEPDLFPYFDVAALSLQQSVDTYRERGHDNVEYWCMGGADLYHRDHGLPRTYDVCMIGGLSSLHRDRARTISRVLALRQEGLNILTGYGAYFGEYSRIYSQSKIVINRSACDQFNMRVFEAAACGAMVLTNVPKNQKDPNAHFLADREHVVYYRSDDEAVELIRYYLRHDEERRQIALAGQKRVLENHTYKNVAADLFEQIVPRITPDFLARRQERLSRWGLDALRQTLDYAKHFYMRGNAQLAQRYYEKADSEAPNTVTSVGRALCSVQQKDPSGMKCYAADALRRATSEEELILAKVSSAMASHHLREALSSREVVGAIDEALHAVQADHSVPASLRDWLYFPPIYDRFRMEISRAFWDIGSVAQRWHQIKRLTTYRLLHLRGLLFLEQGNPRSAVDALSQAVDLIPDDGQLLVDLARAHLACGDQAAAENCLMKAAEEEPLNTQIQQSLTHVRQSGSTPPPAEGDTGRHGLNRTQLTGAATAGFSNATARGKLPDPLPHPLYLNLGCGLDVREGFVNIDLFSDNPRVVGMDVRRLELPDSCADGIIASDILEHFSHLEVDAVLREWARVLKPGGKLAIRCPSLKLQAKAYLSGVWDADVASYMIFGGQTNPGDYHCTGFDQASMTKHLLQAGLEPVVFEETDTPQDRGFINLNMTAHARKVASKVTQPLHQPSGDREALAVAWEGSQFVHHSLALVNREICLQLVDAGHEVSIIPYEPDQFDATADKRLPKLAVRHNAGLSRPADIHVRHQWPPKFDPPEEGHWVIIQPWEFGSLPKEWIEKMRAEVDEVWAPSSWVRQCYIESGMPADRVQVVPNGVDTTRFSRKARPMLLNTQKRFKFLFVGGTIWRKGPDVLLNAYTKAFCRRDDVCLVIKDMGGGSFYKGQTAEEQIRQLQANPEAPEILYLNEDISDADIPGLYTACDCLVHPYRGEGFGLPIAEAMACGLPVIVTGAGACLDYCDDTVAYLVKAEKQFLSDSRIGQWETAGQPYLYEPDAASTGRLMRHVYENRKEARAVGLRARRRILDRFTWQHAAKRAVERMMELRPRPVRRFQTAAQESFEETTDEVLAGGSGALQRGDLDQAIVEFTRAAEKHQHLAAVHTALGSTLMAQGRMEEAISSLRRASELAPKVASIQNQLGIALFTSGDPRSAESSFRQAHSADPSDVQSLLNLVELCRTQDRYEEATQLLKEALQIDPNHADTLAAFAVVCLELGDLDGAEIGLQRLLSNHPDHPDAEPLRQAITTARADTPPQEVGVPQ